MKIDKVEHSEYRKLVEEIVFGSLIMEIGVWLGGSSYGLAKWASENGSILWCVDTFDGRGSGHSETIETNIGYSIGKTYSTLWEFRESVNIFGGNSDRLVDHFPDDSIDFLFLDSDHRYSQVKKDLDLWYPKVRGVMCGHDFNAPHWDERYIEDDYVNGIHHGVTKAVTEKFDKITWYDTAAVWEVRKDGRV